MNEREKIIHLWFEMWLTKQDLGIDNIFAEDVISAMELYKECEKISVLDECLYYYKYNGESLSNTYRPKVYKLLNNLLEWEKAYLKKEQLFE